MILSSLDWLDIITTSYGPRDRPQSTEVIQFPYFLPRPRERIPQNYMSDPGLSSGLTSSTSMYDYIFVLSKMCPIGQA